MAVLEILTVGHPALEQKAVEVERVTKKMVKLAHDMLDTMEAANGIGLAAPQVGEGIRLIVLDLGEEPMILFNPELTAIEGAEIDVEGCLSVPGRWVYVKRSEKVRVSALNEKGKPLRIEAEGLLARALQHELDHLDGILILERMLGEVEVETEEPVIEETKTEAKVEMEVE